MDVDATLKYLLVSFHTFWISVFPFSFDRMVNSIFVFYYSIFVSCNSICIFESIYVF
jgi:hypothetical protein